MPVCYETKQPSGACTLGFFFDLFDRLLEPSHECFRVSQVPLGELEFTDQHTILVYDDESITLFHSDSPY